MTAIGRAEPGVTGWPADGLWYHSPALHNGHPVGAWRSLVARVVRDDKVVGSNPAAPTIPPPGAAGRTISDGTQRPSGS